MDFFLELGFHLEGWTLANVEVALSEKLYQPNPFANICLATTTQLDGFVSCPKRVSSKGGPSILYLFYPPFL